MDEELLQIIGNNNSGVTPCKTDLEKWHSGFLEPYDATYDKLPDRSGNDRYSLLTKDYFVATAANAEFPVINFSAGSSRVVVVGATPYSAGSDLELIISEKLTLQAPNEIEWIHQFSSGMIIYAEYLNLYAIGGFVGASPVLIKSGLCVGCIIELKVYLSTSQVVFEVDGVVKSVPNVVGAGSTFASVSLSTSNTARDFSGTIHDLFVVDSNIGSVNLATDGTWTATITSDPSGDILGNGLSRDIYPNPTNDATINTITGWTNSTALNAGEFRDAFDGEQIFTSDATLSPNRYRALIYSTMQLDRCSQKAHGYVRREDLGVYFNGESVLFEGERVVLSG